MSQEVREYILDYQACHAKKVGQLLKGGKLTPLELPIRKWDHIVLDLIMGRPKYDGIKCNLYYS